MRASQIASRSNPQHDTSSQSGYRKFEFVFALIALLLFSQALLGRLFTTPENPEGGAFLRFMWLPIYVLTFFALARHWRNVLAAVRRSPLLIGISVLAILSALWSLDPGTSLRRGVAVFATTAFGVYLASAFSWKELLRLFGLTWIILGVGSFLTGALIPGFGVMHEIHPGAWRGLWFEKNQMGGYFARSAILFAFLFLMDKDWRKVWIGGFLLSLALVLLSTSKTSLLGLTLGLSILGGWLWMRTNRFLAIASLWLIFTVMLLGIVILLVMPETVAALIGRDLTLTGRTDIWEVLLRVLEERPLFGFGYGTFWAENSPPAMQVRAETEWEVPTAHNGLLEVMLAVGRVGATMFVLDYIINLCRALFSVHHRPTAVYGFAYLTVFVLFSISESVMLNQNDITWVTYCTIAAKLALDSGALKQKPAASVPKDMISPPGRKRPQLRGRH